MVMHLFHVHLAILLWSFLSTLSFSSIYSGTHIQQDPPIRISFQLMQCRIVSMGGISIMIFRFSFRVLVHTRSSFKIFFSSLSLSLCPFFSACSSSALPMPELAL